MICVGTLGLRTARYQVIYHTIWPAGVTIIHTKQWACSWLDNTWNFTFSLWKLTIFQSHRVHVRFRTRLPLLFCTESDKKPTGRDLGTGLPCLRTATMPIFSYHVYICMALTSPCALQYSNKITTHQLQYRYSNIDTAKQYYCSSALQSVLYNLLE